MVIHSDKEEADREIEETVLLGYQGKALLRVADHGNGQLEYIYELTEKSLEAGKKQEKDPLRLLKEIDGVSRVNLVRQNEEMSR